MSSPLITVLMPVYNTEKYVSEAIDSILTQTFSDFEFLIIDDGSTDKSAEIISSYKDKRIRFVKNGTNIKLIATLNKGIDMAKGKYICRMDADDISTPDRLEKQLDIMENHPEYVACASWFDTFFEGSTQPNFIVKYEEQHLRIRLRALYQNQFCHPTSFIRKDFIIKHNLYFDPNFLHSEDYHFFVRLSEIGKLYNIQEALVKVRKHETNVSFLHSITQNANSINVIDYQLNKIGINTEFLDYDLYFRFFYSTFDLNKDEIIYIEEFLIQIIASNKISKYLPEQELDSFLADRFMHLCFNVARHGLWVFFILMQSPLKKNLNISLYRKIRFFIKTLIKYNNIPKIK